MEHDEFLAMQEEDRRAMADDVDVCKECGSVEQQIEGVCQWCGTCSRCGAFGEMRTFTAPYSNYPEDYDVNVCDCGG